MFMVFFCWLRKNTRLLHCTNSYQKQKCYQIHHILWESVTLIEQIFYHYFWNRQPKISKKQVLGFIQQTWYGGVMCILEWNFSLERERAEKSSRICSVSHNLWLRSSPKHPSTLNRADKRFRPCMKLRKSKFIFLTTFKMLINKIC